MKSVTRNLAVAVAVWGMGSVASAAYLSVDFQGDTVGIAPTSASNVSTPGNTEVRVVDIGSIPADPFGGTGNQSAFFRDDSQADAAEATWKGGAGGLTSGTFTIKYIVQDGGTVSGGYADNPYMNIRLGDTAGGSTQSTIGPWIDQNGTTLRFWGPGATAFDQTALLGAVNTLVINFDTSTDTFTGTINGNPLTTGGSNTVHSFYSGLGSLDSFYAGGAWSSRYDVHMFIDDAVIDAVPEPGSALAILGLIGCLVTRRRSNNQE